MVYSKISYLRASPHRKGGPKGPERFNLSVSCADSSSKALRFGNRPVFLSGQSLTDPKEPIRGH